MPCSMGRHLGSSHVKLFVDKARTCSLFHLGRVLVPSSAMSGGARVKATPLKDGVLASFAGYSVGTAAVQ